MGSQSFRISPEGQKAIERKTAQWLLFLFAIVIVIVITFPVTQGAGFAIRDPSTWLTLIIIVPIIGFGYFTSLKKNKAMSASYELVVGEDRITRAMMNLPTITLLKNEVKEIIKSADGEIMIVGNNKLNAIGVSAYIEGREELEKLLTGIKPLTQSTIKLYRRKFYMPIALVTVIVMFVALNVDNKYIATLCGLASSIFMIYSLIVIQRSKNIDARTKRRSYFILFPLLSLILSVLLKWAE